MDPWGTPQLIESGSEELIFSTDDLASLAKIIC